MNRIHHRHIRMPRETLLLMSRGAALALLLSLLAPVPRGETVEIGGYAKSLGFHYQPPPSGGVPGGEAVSNRLRLDLAGEKGETLRWEISVEEMILYSNPPGAVPLPGEGANRRIDLEKDWDRGGRFSDRAEVDRLNMNLRQGPWEATAGRQAIGFGRIALFSPLDIVAPFPPDALDTEVRPGVDALRLGRFLGLGGHVQGVAVFGAESRLNSLLVTAEGNAGGIDILGITGSLRGRSMAGIGAASQLAGMGVKGEIAWYRGERADRLGGDLHNDFPIAALETDYQFGSGLILFAEYLYNGVGAGNPAAYPRVSTSAPLQEGLSYLLGRHYLLLNPSWEAHPLLRTGALLIVNIEDRSFLLRPLLSISLSDNMDLQLFYALSQGRKPRSTPFPPALIPRSEFGSTGDSAGFLLRYFF